MANNELITGLDIGTTKVCALIAEISDHDEVIVTGVGVARSTGMRKGVVVDIEATARAVEDAVGRAVRQAGRSVESVYVGVTGEHISSVNSSARIAITHPDREVTVSDVNRVKEAARVIVLPPDRQILHAIPRSFSIDGQGQIKRPVGMSGARLEVEMHIVHGAVTFLQNVEKSVARAGLQIDELVLEPIATAEAVLLDDEKDLGVCLVDIGGGTSDLAIYVQGEIIYSAVIPVGGSHVTSDLAYGLTVAVEEAERLKTENGSALLDMVPEEDVISVRQVGRSEQRKLRRRALVQIIEPRMQELFELVREELSKADCLHRVPAGLVISGGGSQLVGCAEVARDVLKMPVRVGGPFALGGLGETLDSPIYATAVGLVKYGARQLREEQELAPRHGRPDPEAGWMERLINWLRDLFASH